MWQKGQSGNPKGKVANPFAELLREAIIEVEEEKKEKLLKLYVKKAYIDKSVLMHCVDKLVPSLIETKNETKTDLNIEEGVKEFVDDITNRIESRTAKNNPAKAADVNVSKDGDVPK